jgi:SAM-dependent methyltransferase
VLPERLEGIDVVELGCGTGYISAWLARRGARAVGLDLTEAQLATAREMQGRFDLRFPLVQADAERVPLRDASFDLAISEYGAAIWCDPYRWIPEAARLLRPGGELIFLGNGTLLVLCEPDYESDGPSGTTLLRPYFGMHRFEWPDDEGVDFHLGYGDMIRLLRSSGFEVEDLIEVRPGPEATTTWELVDLAWARRWPCEEIWKARKVG